MSIEQDLHSIAKSLVLILGRMPDEKEPSAPAPAAPAPAAPAPAAPAPAAPAPAAPAPAAPAPAAPAPAAQMLPGELNKALVVQFTRLGGNKIMIDNVIKAHGADNITALDPAKYASVLAAVKAL